MADESQRFTPEEVLQVEGQFKGAESDRWLAQERAEAERRYTDPDAIDKLGQCANTLFGLFSGGAMEDAFPGQEVEGDAAVSEEIKRRALAFAEQNGIPEADRGHFAEDAVAEFEQKRAKLKESKQ